MTTAHIQEKRVGLYLRVSTSEQTTDNQRRELMAVAERHGWAVVQVFEDAGISGAKSRKDRPALDALLKDAKDVDLFLHQQGLDTSTPSGRAMFQMMGVFAEFERAMIRERVMSGLAQARDEGKRLGRPRLDDKKAEAIRRARATGKGIRSIARDLGVGVGTVLRVTGEAEGMRAIA
jgi:DNA invertase Pin-like site-specific DNA recombinase